MGDVLAFFFIHYQYHFCKVSGVFVGFVFEYIFKIRFNKLLSDTFSTFNQEVCVNLFNTIFHPWVFGGDPIGLRMFSPRMRVRSCLSNLKSLLVDDGLAKKHTTLRIFECLLVPLEGICTHRICLGVPIINVSVCFECVCLLRDFHSSVFEAS